MIRLQIASSAHTHPTRLGVLKVKRL